MLTPPQSDLAGVVKYLSQDMRDALEGAWEFEGRLYHDGVTVTGKALYRRRLVTIDGELNERGLAARQLILSAQSRTEGERT